MARTAGKKKICWNCEGDVPRETVNCPYCAVYLHPEDDDLPLEDDEEDLSPPYQINTPPEQNFNSSSTTQNQQKPLTLAFSGWKGIIIPLVSLLFGTLFLLFAFLLFIFSQNGVLTLQWNSELWIIYSAIALPLLFIGWKTLQSIED